MTSPTDLGMPASGRQSGASDRGPGSRRTLPAWPVLLIIAGLLLFATNLGWVEWDALLGIAYLWPVALIAAGVDLLLRGRYRLLVVVGAFLAAIAVHWAGTGSLGLGAAPPTEAVRHALAGAQRAEVTIVTGVARLRVDSDRDAVDLVDGTVAPLRGERLEHGFESDGGVARLTLRSDGPVSGSVTGRTGRWDLTLSGAVPIGLRVETGVGESVLELGQLQLASLDVETGVGAMNLTLPSHGGYSGSVDTGVGAATVRIPEGVAARLTISRGLGAVSVPDDFVRDGDVYTSEGYAAASDRLDLRISSGVGAVDVRRTR